MSTPDLSPERTTAEAVAFGKLAAVREVLDALTKHRPPAFPGDETTRGYDLAVRVAKGVALGVEAAS